MDDLMETTVTRVTQITREVGRGMNMRTMFVALLGGSAFLVVFQMILLITN
jgi:hypothetical protein